MYDLRGSANQCVRVRNVRVRNVRVRNVRVRNVRVRNVRVRNAGGGCACMYGAAPLLSGCSRARVSRFFGTF